MAENGQSRTARRKQKKASKKPLWKKTLLTAVIALAAIGIGVGVLFTYYISTAPEIDASKLESPFSSKLYDKEGELFADLGAEQRTKVEYNDLPDVLIDAVVATEDSRFFEHPGIDIWRIGGAVVANIKNGFGSEGASTITQQLVEKSFLSHEKKISIKVQEMWLALKLERKYDKKEIMEMYLNKIYYGKGAYGVAKAAETYFGKTDLNKLTLPEAAILAGLPQRPSAYNPFENPELMKERRDTVLHLMVQHEKITKNQSEKARNTDITALLKKDSSDPTPYEGFLQRVQQEVQKKVGGADIYTDGLKIYTTIDQDAQKYVEFLMSDSEDNPVNYPEAVTNPKKPDGDKVNMQAGMSVLDTKTGAIRAIGGARGGNDNLGTNYALGGKVGISRQPGSTFKPIIGYGPAIENKQWSTYHQLNDDGPLETSKDKEINTWASQYYGWVSTRYALQQSLNVPAAKTYKEVGGSTAKKFAEGLGIDIEEIMLSDVLGGNTLTNPTELAGAYRAFANGGIYNEPYAVTKVEFPENGKTVNLKPEPEAAMSDYTAYMITDMLKSVIREGTGVRANIPGLQVAGKTGTTTRDTADGSPDSWFSGYTTNYTISIWTGYDNNNIGMEGSETKVPHQLFKNTMTELSKGIETPDFTKPDSVVEVAVEEGTRPAKLPSEYTPASEVVTELFVKGHEPSKTSEEFDQLDPIENLKAAFNKESDTINAEWEYDSNRDVSFEVSASIDGGQMQELSSTEKTSIEISNVEPGTEYKIQVVAASNKTEGNTSKPVTTAVSVPDKEDKDKDENKDEDKEKDENEEDNKEKDENEEDNKEKDENEEDNKEENGGRNITAVQGLNAKSTSNSTIDVSWQYNGAPAKYEVVVARDGQQLQSQTIESKGIVIEGDQGGPLQPGNYTITVTPIGKNGANSGSRGDSSSADANIEGEQSEQGEQDEQNQQNQQNENGDAA